MARPLRRLRHWWGRVWQKGTTPPPAEPQRRFWLFYMGPEEYLDETGERPLPSEAFWSCAPETRRGDLILVYRLSLNHPRTGRVIRGLKLSPAVLRALRRNPPGKDFPAIWLAASDAKRQPFWWWRYGCGVRELERITPPLTRAELLTESRLEAWEGWRENLKAGGRAALEVPPFAWDLINDLIRRRRLMGPSHSRQTDPPKNPDAPPRRMTGADRGHRKERVVS